MTLGRRKPSDRVRTGKSPAGKARKDATEMKKRLMTAALMLSVMLAACGQGKAQASTAAAAESGTETETRESDGMIVR